jgi:hypothetical protein
MGRTEVGVGHQSSRGASLTFPFKGKDGMGMGVLISMLEIAISP